MALVVEDGSGKSDAESYVSVTDATTYHSNRANDTWRDFLTSEREKALRRATDYMVQVYRTRWRGVRTTATQALDWPRAGVLAEDFADFEGTPSFVLWNNAYYIPSDSVPVEIKNACSELALKALTAALSPDLERGVLSERVGPLAVQYDAYSPEYKRFRAIDNMLRPLLRGATAGYSRAVVRT